MYWNYGLSLNEMKFFTINEHVQEGGVAKVLQVVYAIKISKGAAELSYLIYLLPFYCPC